MQAIRVHEAGGPEVMQWQELPDPEPAPGQVVVRIEAAGVNPVDTYMRGHENGYAPALPFTPGLDAAGIVETVGDGVTHLQVGQRVYLAGSLSGTYAEKALCLADRVYPLPDNVGFVAGATINVPAATAYRALIQRAAARAGERVLVHGGSGAVGLAAIQIAQAHGLEVHASASSKPGRDLLQSQGVEHVYDHSDDAHFEQVLDATGGDGVDVIVEMLANRNLPGDFGLLARGGRVVVVGNRGTVEINPRDLMSRDASLLGMSLLVVDDATRDHIHAELYHLLEQEKLQPVVRQTLPMAQAAEAHRLVMQPGACGNIVLLNQPQA